MVGEWTEVGPCYGVEDWDYDRPTMTGEGPLAGRQLGGPQSDFVIVEWTDPGASEREWIAPLHVHHADDEAWYVLEGVLRFRIDEETFEAVLVPRSSPRRERRMLIARQSVVSRRATCLS